MWQIVQDYLKRIPEYGWGKVGFELLLIGLVLYVVWRFLRGTRGLRLMRGLIVILVSLFLVLDVLAAHFHLDRINVLFSPMVYLIFFGSLVVFQPELRRALMRLGEATWLRRFISDTQQTTAPIVSAVRSLSMNKIGALIAIERQVELGSIVENGVRMDAVITPELLRTIFWPGTALHDLGVVIQEGRIAAAACQFPLTDSDQVDPTLGSRHRAAVGLSEDCDAVVIVVSEETGNISMAVQGKLYRGLTPEALDRDLKRLLEIGGKRE
ncbi:MAG: TIGR00159 family protein [Phycisphaerae bacterium]|nr:TIGR00159 family protein [Phycisphaerae bacterium]